MGKKPFGIIYKATNKINGKVYIGQTIHSFKTRKREHEYCKYNIPFHKAIKKYGKENFDWEIVERCRSKIDLDLAEEWYIRYYKTFVAFDSCCGYNCTFGGEGRVGWVPSNETRKKISKANKGRIVSLETRKRMSKLRKGIKRGPFSEEHKRNIAKTKKGKWAGKENPKYRKGYLIQGKNNGMFGKKHSKETREKISKALSGSKHTLYGKKIPIEQRKKMDENRSHWWLIIFPDGNKIIIRNLSNFCNKYNLSDSAMNNVAHGLGKHHKGFKCKKLYSFVIERIGKC